MSFRITTLLYFVALLAASLAVFGAWGALIGSLALLLQPLLYFCLTTRWDWPLLLSLVTLILVALILFALLLPVSSGPITPSRSNESMNQLRQITQALLNYEANHGRFPPPYVTDDDGNKLFSWRVLLLPYLEYDYVYKQFHFDEPWDSPHNRQLLSSADIFTSPRVGRKANEVGLANYVAIVGPQTIWAPPTRVRMRDVTDGPSSTFAIVEVGSEEGIHWSEPQDISTDKAVEMLTQWPSKSLVHRKPGYFYTLVYPRNTHIVRFSMVTLTRFCLLVTKARHGNESP